MKNYQILKINENEFAANEIATINTPEEKTRNLRRLGVNVIANTIKALKFATNSDTISCIIFYGNPNNYFKSILDDTREDIQIYIKTNNNYQRYLQTPKTARDRYLDKKEYRETAHTARLENIEARTNRARIPEERKAKMRKYLRYYELDIPQTEPEWVEAFEQLAFYIKNKIPYSFDTNLYYICPECGELIRRGTEEEHICYAEIAPKRVHMDYVINNEEAGEY